VSPRFQAVCLLFALLGLLPAAPLFAGGRSEDQPETTVRDTWVLSVTQFDLSMLSPAGRVVGDVIKRQLVEKLDTVNFRLRLSPEIAFYEGYEWRRSVQTSAQALARLQNDRALIIFRGEPDWRQRRALRTIDANIERISAELAEREAARPIINVEPVFALSPANLGGSFPVPPRPGGERNFARAQNSDAVLFGEIREFHGRFFIRLRLYALYLNDFIYEDDIIFSREDIYGAVNEITISLTSALSGNPPARLAVAAYPGDAQILINRGYAGTGTVEAVERPPGTVTVAVAAPGHTPEDIEVKLVAGELVEVDVTLGLMPTAEVNLDVPGVVGLAVYHGALFLGETPLTVSLPIGSLAYFTLEDRLTGHEARAIVTAPDMPGEMFDFTFRLSPPPPPGGGASTMPAPGFTGRGEGFGQR